jgi:hypothetical protein
MKWLAFLLTGGHAFLCITVFGLALSDPGRRGMLPILVYVADYPASLVCEAVRRALHGHVPLPRLAVDGLTYLAIGSLWYYVLGTFLRVVIGRLARTP